MMYNSKLVMAVKVDGKILREQKDVAYIPFGSEYTLLIKNLHSTKVMVDIEIDGTDVLDMSSILIGPSEEIELEGFLQGNDVTNKFKFIKKTQAISDHRGDKIDDGIICVKFRFEEEKPVVKKEIVEITTSHKTIWDYPHYPPYYNPCRSIHYVDPYRVTYGSNTDSVVCASADTSNNTSANASQDASQVMYACADISASTGSDSIQKASHSVMDWMENETERGLDSDDGITVKGSKTDQHFSNSTIGKVEEASYTMVLHLKGIKSNASVVTQPITVKTKLSCDSCGKASKSSMTFCGYCGTSLV